MKVSVIIPTFRRPDSLENCLEALRTQQRPADEILLVILESDLATKERLEKWQHFKALRVLAVTTAGGAIAQFNAGLPQLQGDIVVMTDDDAVPHPDWLARIEQHFMQNPDVGGVGGRDHVYQNGRWVTGNSVHVGKVLWFGRVTGNHHLGTRFYPNVDVLKGVNMAYRATAIQGLLFDTDLRGKGSQTCQDMSFSMEVQKRGWRLLYDAKVAVDHYPAPRFDADQRGAPTQEATEDTSFNLYLSLLRHMRRGSRRTMALLWMRLVGIRATPGLLRGAWARVRQQRAALEQRQIANRAWREARRVTKGEA